MTTSSKPISKKSSQHDISLNFNELVYPYYEWIKKDTVVAWVKMDNGSVVATFRSEHTSKDAMISGLAETLNEPHQPYGMILSPDGKKALYLLVGRGSPAKAWRIGTFNGTGYTGGDLLEGNFGYSAYTIWKRDSQGWLGLLGTVPYLSVVHYNVNGTTPPLKVPITGFVPEISSGKKRYMRILGLRQDGIAVMSLWRANENIPINIYTLDINTGKILPDFHQVHPPNNARTMEIILSHSGDKIAWLFINDRKKKNTSQKFTRTIEIWVSENDGKNLKKLSDFAPLVLRNDDLSDDLEASLLRWTLDDNSISYLEGGVVHLIKVK